MPSTASYKRTLLVTCSWYWLKYILYYLSDVFFSSYGVCNCIKWWPRCRQWRHTFCDNPWCETNVTWASWPLRLPAFWLFVQQFIPTTTKRTPYFCITVCVTGCSPLTKDHECWTTLCMCAFTCAIVWMDNKHFLIEFWTVCDMNSP